MCSKSSPITSWPRASPSRLQIRPLTFDETVLGSTSTNSRATQRRAHHHTAVPAAAKGLTEILLEHPAETPVFSPPTAPYRRYDRDLPPLDHESTRNATVRSFRLREPRIASCSSSCSRRSRPLSSTATLWLPSMLLDI